MRSSSLLSHWSNKLSVNSSICRSQWTRGLWRRYATARLLRSWVRIPPGGHGYLSVVSVVCCQVEVSATSWSLVQGVLPTVVRRCVWSRNLKNEEAMTRVGSQRHSKKRNSSIYSFLISRLLERVGGGAATGQLGSDIRTTDVSFILQTLYRLLSVA